MRKLKLNKDLAEESLTRRQVKNIRDRLAKQASFIGNLMEAHWAGVNTCQECQKEYDFKLERQDMDLIKIIYSKTVTDLKDEDLDVATGETSNDDKAKAITSAVINDKSGKVREALKDKGYKLVPILEDVSKTA